MRPDSGISAPATSDPGFTGARDRRIRELEARLAESEETLEAIRRGDIDAVVVGGVADGHRVYTLESADRPYRVLIEQIQEGAVTLDTEGVVFYANRRLAEMLGVAQERVIGQPLQAFLRGDDRAAFGRLLDEARHATARGELSIFPGGTEAGDAAPVPVRLSLSLLQRDDAPLLCGVVADLTPHQQHMRAMSEAHEKLRLESVQRAAVEDALRQSQKMEAVGQLTGGLAHDFNNLLTGIVGGLELVQTRLAQGRTDELPRYLEAAMASANRATALTHRLLAFSRRQTLDPRHVAPNALIGGMLDLLGRTVGPTVTVSTVLDPSVGAILCDPNQLENALLNLAINARDAMPDGGRLTVETGEMTVSSAFARARDMPAGRYVVLSVTDTGAGMAPAVVARAFDPFFTTKPLGQGTGLGLSMIYGFAKQSGGQVRIHSQEGIGTAVQIYLPRSDGEAEGTSVPEAAPPAARSKDGETVLVVDDEPVIRMLVTELLDELGYQTLEAGDGAEGLHKLETGRRIDMLVTDVGLPGGMNGRQLADAARALQPRLKVLFITGYAEGAIVGSVMLEDGMAVLVKPFTMEALAAKVREMIHGPTPGRAPG